MLESATDCDVLVCGLGPVGLLLANLLSARGVRAIALDAAAGPFELPRAAVVDDEVLRIFQAAGLDEPILQDAQIQRKISFLTADGQPLDLLDTASGPLGQPPLVSINQPAMERTMLAALERHACVDARWAQRLEAIDRRADRVVAWVRPSGGGPRFALTGRWLVGCDGARSTVRSHLGIAYAGSTFAQPWLVVDAVCDRPIASVRNPTFVGDPERPVVTLPMSPGRHRWEWMLRPGDDAADLSAPERVAALVEPWLSGERVEIERAVVYTFHARHARRWRAGRVLLAGDAAHVMPPFAGQGFAAGARDAMNLAWKLEAVLGGAPERLMDSYEAERRPHVAAMAALAVRWGRIVQTTSPRTAAWRDRAVRAMSGAPALAERLKPPPAYRRGAFEVRPARAPWRRSVGTLFPQPTVGTASGELRLDDALGHGWVALSRDPQATSALANARLRVLELGVDLQDTSGALRAWLDRRGCDWVLLRPDRFVFACGGLEDVADALVALRRVLPSARSAAAQDAALAA